MAKKKEVKKKVKKHSTKRITNKSSKSKIKSTKRECVNCHKIIKSNEHYFLVREFKSGKKIEDKYCHKSCQDKYDNNMKALLITPEKMSSMLAVGTNIVEQLMNNQKGNNTFDIDIDEPKAEQSENKKEEEVIL